jgi:hypothetical protein
MMRHLTGPMIRQLSYNDRVWRDEQARHGHAGLA